MFRKRLMLSAIVILLFFIYKYSSIFQFFFNFLPSSIISDIQHDLITNGCKIKFINTHGIEWPKYQKAYISKNACYIVMVDSGFNNYFDKDILLDIDRGIAGATTIELADSYLITFYTADASEPKIAYDHFLHEFGHVLYLRYSKVDSFEKSWLETSRWECKNKECFHSCQQTEDKSFYCSYKNYEVLPSRYGSVDYSPDFADVSINPIEDFAESNRYFITANDELSKTSPSRCEYFKQKYFFISQNPCYDCNSNTACIYRFDTRYSNVGK